MQMSEQSIGDANKFENIKVELQENSSKISKQTNLNMYVFKEYVLRQNLVTWAWIFVKNEP